MAARPGGQEGVSPPVPIGHVVEVHGPVVDIACERLPPLRRALYVASDHEPWVLEVFHHLDQHQARAIALHRTAGLRRGTPVYDRGDGHREYLALPVGVLYFVADTLHVTTRHYLRGTDARRVGEALARELLEEEQALADMKEKDRRTLLAQTVFLGTLSLLFIVPVVAGAYLGRWRDGRSAGYAVRWTMSLLVVGLVVGAVNVYAYVRRH
jgi:ATP synthase protein I